MGKKKIAVITADIANSTKIDTAVWLSTLKTELDKLGSNPKDWEIYRGDSFQLALEDPTSALLNAIKIKAALKSKGKVEIRISIGIGDRAFEAEKVTESNGSAFVNSGEKFELLRKEKQSLAVKSDFPEFDAEMNLYIKLGLIAMDNWTKLSAEVVKLMIENPTASQQEIGQRIGIRQNAVSNRLKRAYFAELMELNEMYKAKLGELL